MERMVSANELVGTDMSVYDFKVSVVISIVVIVVVSLVIYIYIFILVKMFNKTGR